MSKARIYARNLAANWIGHGASMVVLFFLSPFVIHTLGLVQYGIWSLLTVVTGYMGILDLGVRASTGRHVTLYIGKEDHQSVDETIRTSLTFFSTIGILIVAVGVVLGWVFPSAFSSVPAEYNSLIRLLLPLLALNIWLTTFRSVLASVMIAHDRFDLTNGVDLVMLVIRTVGTILVLNAGMGLLGLTLVVVGCNIVGMACTWVLARRTYRRLRVWPFMFSRPRMRELLGYGIAAFVSAIAIRLMGQTSLVVVGAALDVSAVAVFSVGAMLVFYSSTFVGIIAGTFFPPVQRAVARGEMGSVRWLFHRQVRLAMILGLPVYVGFIIFGRSFIRLWMLGREFGPESVETAAVVMGILAGSKLLYLLTVGSDELLAATGHIKYNAGIAIVEGVCNLSLSVLFLMVFGWGLAGVAAGTLVARLLTRTFALPWYACRQARINWGKFLLGIGGAEIVTGSMFIAWCLLVQNVLSGDSWVGFWVQVGVAMLGYVPMAFWILLPADDRKRIWRRLRPRAAREETH